MLRKFLWGQRGFDMPRHISGQLATNPAPFEIERPHGQMVIHLDVLVEVLDESSRLGDSTTHQRAYRHLLKFDAARTDLSDELKRRIPDYRGLWEGRSREI